VQLPHFELHRGGHDPGPLKIVLLLLLLSTDDFFITSRSFLEFKSWEFKPDLTAE
jgi:hypothetical protein